MTGLIVLDTSLATRNTGDEIIARSVLRLFPELLTCVRIPTHRKLFPGELRALRDADVAVFLGTNVLDTHLWRRRQWTKGPAYALAAHKKVAWLGVGWQTASPPATLPTKMFMKQVKLPGLPVSARDTSTAQKVRDSGFDAVMTSCPTAWGLTGPLPVLADEREVVATVTDYKPDPERDSAMLRLLGQQFEHVRLWPQGLTDPMYFRKLDLPDNLTVLEPGLADFERTLEGRAFVGTRLHAGMRALQLGSPTLIVEVDHRAREMGKDIGLLTVERESGAAALKSGIEAMAEPRTLDLPKDVIKEWVGQLAAITGLDLPIYDREPNPAS